MNHQHNIEIVCNIKNNQGIYILDNQIHYDDRYFSYWRDNFNLTLFQELYQEAFNYYLNLIFDKYYKKYESLSLLDKLSNQEFLENNYLLLEKSLEGLHRIENYYKIDNKDRIYELLKNKLENKKITNNAFNNNLINIFKIYKSPVINFFSKNNKKIL
jgi:hypothetical protein